MKRTWTKPVVTILNSKIKTRAKRQNIKSTASKIITVGKDSNLYLGNVLRKESKIPSFPVEMF